MEVSTNIESVVSLLETGNVSDDDIDFTDLTNNTHQMLTNLEANIREDQEKSDKKIDDLATIIEGFSIILESIPAENKLTLDQINERVAPVQTRINGLIRS